ncbi:MAG TPA: DUF975 family protein [Chitinophagales bacterium]|nr:DUF975 family protein [Chitinophagales bacterium]
MATKNIDLMRRADEALKGKWKQAVLVALIYLLISITISSTTRILGPLVSLIINGPMALGLAIYFLALSRNQPVKLDFLFDGFKIFGKALATYLLMVVYVFLWLLLFIVPGIIAALSYSQAFFILADNPHIQPSEALAQSKKMMDGYKWKLFKLGLAFFGMVLLCILTLGIGLLWLVPFMQVTAAKFYDDIKTERATVAV